MSDCKKAFRPSSISRYTNCNLWRHFPFEEKTLEQLVYLQKGTDAHARLEKEQFTDKETECKAYFQSIKDRCIYFFKEQHLDMEIAGEFLEGTPDVYGYDEASKTLQIIDYKTGRSYVVAENNDQLLAYAMLVMHRHDDWKVEKIELAILNTQHDAVNRHVYMGTLYLERLKARIERALEKNTLEESFGRPGSWCQFCPSKRYCIRQKSYQTLKNYADLDTDRLIFETRSRSAEMTSREKEVRAGAVSDLLKPLLSERSKRVWKQEEELPEKFLIKTPMTVKAAAETFPIEEIEPYTKKASYTILKKPA
jgi:hypothetical protein